MYLGYQGEVSGIWVLAALAGLFIPTIFVPYQYWKFNCQYVSVSTQDLIRCLERQPLSEESQHLITELGNRGSDGLNAAPLLVETFERCVDAPMAEVRDYKTLQFSVVKSLLQMGRPLDAIQAITDFLANPPKGDWEGNPKNGVTS